MKTFFGTLSLFALLLVSFVAPTSVIAQDEPQLAVSDAPIVYIYGRDDCGFCKAELAWLQESDTRYIYLNITENETAKQQWEALAKKHGISKVTPITVVGADVFVGFGGAETTGKAITDAVVKNTGGGIYTPEEHLKNAPSQQVSNQGTCTDLECEESNAQAYVFDLPFVGIVDLKSFSLITLSLVLGTIDGFNPCAMWVLITFLVLLSQAGSRKKMVFLAGIFIVAEAIMYNLILNVWYQVWDFVALDQIVTPLVGLLALGGGAFFLYRWQKNKEVALVCDISDIETQSKTISRFEAIARQPLTLATVAAIIVIAFSVNIIEFACSIGIPQAYTKILDLNALTFVERQFYIMMYTLGYMVDDFLVFGLAIWGYGKLEAHGHRYAQLSLLIGGALMLVLGLMLVFNPDLLVIG
jgi:cytochrome c biogenesis protein CcdA/glutaredoxin